MATTQTKTAEEMNMERRAVKQRRNAAARAKAAARKGGVAEFSISDTVKAKKKHDNWMAQRRRTTDYLMGLLIQKGALIFAAPDYYDDAFVYKNWAVKCRDLIKAAKAHESRFEWNKDWEIEERLTIAVQRQVAA